LQPVSITAVAPAANLPLVSLIPIVQISPRILEKFEMTLLLCPGAWGKMIHEKWSKKSRDTGPLKHLDKKKSKTTVRKN
jgi:hypothetical protein